MRLLFYILLLSSTLSAQQTVYLDSDVFTVDKAKEQVDYVCNHLGIRNNFKLRQNQNLANVARAYKEGNQRYILYGQSGMQSVYDSAHKNSWATIAVFLHEIAHHLNNDTDSISSHSRISQEMKADFFAGFHLQRMGASQEDALSVLNFMGENDGLHFHGTSYTITHPPKSMRSKQIIKGWESAKSLNQK